MIWIFVFIAGGIGAWCRFKLDGLIQKHWRHSIPIGTLTINVLGCFGLGLLTGILWHHPLFSPISTVFGTGMMGGFTTFSTANVEVVRIGMSGRPIAGLELDIATVVLALLAALGGISLGSL